MLKTIRTFSWLLLALLLLGCTPSGEQSYVVGGDVAVGEELVTAYGCGSCHVIPHIPGANATVGPPLTNWAERVYIAGALPNRPGNLVQWLMDPQAIEPGTAMPDLSITEQEARDMSAFLYSLR
ncbi:MAG: c-type cytochrome [Anaerolineaceae bacterium]|nr:c-type cytochrome [Anaerolineaceae bacterium]